jgi:hypothetical protein
VPQKTVRIISVPLYKPRRKSLCRVLAILHFSNSGTSERIRLLPRAGNGMATQSVAVEHKT